MNKLQQLRTIIASLDETLVNAFCGRALFRVNDDLYNEHNDPLPVADTATRFGSSPTIAGRGLLLRPLYVKTLLPILCSAGTDPDRRKCIAADASCLNALVQRLNLSVHVAALKREEIPEPLRLPLEKRDPIQLETAITNHAVEAEVIGRILEMSRIRQNHTAELPEKISRLYADWIIPLSRKIQVHDLLAKYHP